jgi:hypothetical protein
LFQRKQEQKSFEASMLNKEQVAVLLLIIAVVLYPAGNTSSIPEWMRVGLTTLSRQWQRVMSFWIARVAFTVIWTVLYAFLIFSWFAVWLYGNSQNEWWASFFWVMTVSVLLGKLWTYIAFSEEAYFGRTGFITRRMGKLWNMESFSIATVMKVWLLVALIALIWLSTIALLVIWGYGLWSPCWPDYNCAYPLAISVPVWVGLVLYSLWLFIAMILNAVLAWYLSAHRVDHTRISTLSYSQTTIELRKV